MVGIAEYSRDCLRQLRAETGIEYDNRSLGTLQLFRKQKQLDAIGGDVEVLQQYGVPYEVLDQDGCIRAEPALQAVRDRFVGGLRLPDDETGDCFVFTQKLADMATRLGVEFCYQTEIKSIDVRGNRITGIETVSGRVEGDVYIVALGSFSPWLLKPLGIFLPVYPVKGYSLTIPIENERAAPVSTVMDETYKVAITRLGNRIRVGGTAEVGNYVVRLSEKRRAPLERSLLDLFPDGGDVSKATFWSGLRPMTPDGPPVIGRTPYRNLYLNTGHGTLGWTMACGSGRVLADIAYGRTPDIPIEALSMERV
jgi:D-amino-acid dehydrogenase